MSTTEIATFDHEPSLSLQDQQEAFAEMPEALKVEFKRVRTWMEGVNEYALKKRWELGRRMEKLASDTTGKFGKDPIAQMSKASGADKGYLLKARHFFTDFEEKPRLDFLLTLRMKASKKPISWTHVLQILSIPEAGDRDRFLRLTAENDWTPEELTRAIRREFNRESRGGGRGLAIPQKLDSKLLNLTKIYSVCIRNDKEIWRHDEHGILQAVESTPADKLSQSTMEQLEESLKVAQQAKDAATADIAMLKKAKKAVGDKIKEQAKQQATEEVAAAAKE